MLIRSLGLVAIRRHLIRPVLKHGPRSLACRQVKGTYESPWRNESKGVALSRLGVILGFGRGAAPARSVTFVSGAEQEPTCWDPKDGELCLSRLKSEETLMEDRSDSDVQIDRRT
jgi:hypothetical protein